MRSNKCRTPSFVERTGESGNPNNRRLRPTVAIPSARIAERLPMRLTTKCKSSVFLAAALLGWICTPAVHAQAPSPAAAATAALPTSDDVINHYVKAIGGQDAWKKISSRQFIGTIEIPAMSVSGTLESHEKAPDKMLSVVVVAGSAFRRGFDGKAAWADDPQNGLRELTGPEFDDTKREADFYRPLNLQKTYSKIAVTGTEKVGDHDAYVVDATLPSGDTDKLYFDTQSGLLVKSIGQQHTPQGAVTMQVELSDYRDTDGVKLPYAIHQSTPQFEFNVKFTEVHTNVSFDDAQFSKPAAQ